MVILGEWVFIMSEVPLWARRDVKTEGQMTHHPGWSSLRRCMGEARREGGPHDLLSSSVEPSGSNDVVLEMWSGFEEGSYLRLVDFGITQL